MIDLFQQDPEQLTIIYLTIGCILGGIRAIIVGYNCIDSTSIRCLAEEQAPKCLLTIFVWPILLPIEIITYFRGQ